MKGLLGHFREQAMSREKSSSTINDKRDLSRVANCLQYFDNLPGSANVRLPTVLALFGCSAPTVYRMIARGQLEKPIKLGPRISVWNVEALRKSLAAFRIGI